MDIQEVLSISRGERRITDLVDAGQYIMGAQAAQESSLDPRDYLGNLSPAAIEDVRTILRTNGVALAPDNELIRAYFLPENNRAIFFVTEDLDTEVVVGEVRIYPDETVVKGWKQSFGWLR